VAVHLLTARYKRSPLCGISCTNDRTAYQRN